MHRVIGTVICTQRMKTKRQKMQVVQPINLLSLKMKESCCTSIQWEQEFEVVLVVAEALPGKPT